MLPRLLWCALAVALIVGTAQSLLQQVQALPIVLAAETLEALKVQASGASNNGPAEQGGESKAGSDHAHSASAHDHHHHESAHDFAQFRTLWTWIANSLHALSAALLFFSGLLLWFWKSGKSDHFVTATAVAAGIGFVSLHVWPSLGLPAEIPGMDAAALGDRQSWWVFSAASAMIGCGLMAFAAGQWRWPVALAILALPFIVGAPNLVADPFSGYSGEVLSRLQQLSVEFVWASRWLAVSFWILIAVSGGLLFRRWLLPLIIAPAPRSLDSLRTS